MTLQECKLRIIRIMQKGIVEKDDEAANDLERQLLYDVILSQIQGYQDIEVLKEVVQVRSLDFRRY